MKFLFDTGHISIRQRKSEPDCSNIAARAARYLKRDFAYSIVSFEEQTRGANAYVAAGRKPEDVVRRYPLLEMVLDDYRPMTVLSFDEAAGATFSQLLKGGVKVATMDLRIASIAVSQGLIILTRNNRDFERVPGLVTEDWTIPAR
jgi:tRNA(fMet)-specific endonuclease VapC